MFPCGPQNHFPLSPLFLAGNVRSLNLLQKWVSSLRSNYPSPLYHLTFISIPLKVFESMLNRKAWIYLKFSNDFSVCQLSFLSNTLLVIFTLFSPTLGSLQFDNSVNLLLGRYISEAFDRVNFLFRYLSYSLGPSLI